MLPDPAGWTSQATRSAPDLYLPRRADHCLQVAVYAHLVRHVGRSGFTIGAVASLFDNASNSWSDHELRVELWVAPRHRAVGLKSLRQEQETIESELGYPVEIDDFKVYVRRTIRLDEPERWEAHYAWLAQHVGDFLRVFKGRVAGFDPGG